jgi:hypothetical protein
MHMGVNIMHLFNKAVDHLRNPMKYDTLLAYTWKVIIFFNLTMIFQRQLSYSTEKQMTELSWMEKRRKRKWPILRYYNTASLETEKTHKHFRAASTNPTQSTLGLNQGLCGEKPKTNRTNTKKHKIGTTYRHKNSAIFSISTDNILSYNSELNVTTVIPDTNF